MSIPDQHKFLIQLIFPNKNNSVNHLSLTESDREFILNKMSMLQGIAPIQNMIQSFMMDIVSFLCLETARKKFQTT